MEPGGFSIPAELVDRESGALALIIHAQGLHGRPRGPIRMAQLLLAEWLLTDPAELPGAVETAGIALGEVLAGVATLSPEAGIALYNLTGGAIRLADWTRYYCGPVDPSLSPQGGGADRVLAPSPTPIVHGRLGETPPGKLFYVVRGEVPQAFILTGMGAALAMDRGQAMSAFIGLAEALGIAWIDPKTGTQIEVARP